MGNTTPFPARRHPTVQPIDPPTRTATNPSPSRPTQSAFDWLSDDHRQDELIMTGHPPVRFERGNLGAEVGPSKGTALAYAVREGNAPMLKWLLKQGVPQRHLVAADHQNFTPLVRACFDGRLDICKALFSQGGEATLKPPTKTRARSSALTPLMAACASQNTPLVQWIFGKLELQQRAAREASRQKTGRDRRNKSRAELEQEANTDVQARMAKVGDNARHVHPTIEFRRAPRALLGTHAMLPARPQPQGGLGSRWIRSHLHVVRAERQQRQDVPLSAVEGGQGELVGSLD